MSNEEFREKLKNNRALKVASLAYDRVFDPVVLVEDFWRIFLFLFAIGAMHDYLELRINTETTEFDALMCAAGKFVAHTGILYLAKYCIIKIIKYLNSVEDVSNELNLKDKKQEQIARGQAELPETTRPIDQKVLSQYLSAKFKGMGANENYMPQLLKDLEILQKTSPTEVQRFAVMLYESKVMVNKPAQFNEWVKIFFNIVGMEHPKYISRSKHKPTPGMIERYYYIPPLPKKGVNSPL